MTDLTNFNFGATSYQQEIITNENKYSISSINQLVFEYKYNIKLKEFFIACEHVKKNCSALRTRFTFNEELKVIAEKYDESIKTFFLKNTEKNEVKSRQDYLKEDRLNTFKPFDGNLIRITLVKEKINKYYSILSYHKAAIDYKSAILVIEIINEAYEKLISGQKPVIENDLIYFKNIYDYIYENVQKFNKYWIEQLSKINDKTDSSVFRLKYLQDKNDPSVLF